ncbi:uncharacterized protein YfbL-like [Ptychodera flava]|uniref:uncharacterized protein YfbL-like n=1 Tax=Ptychodera flava TaxID=63121 RepID=UPI00396A3171
MAITTRNAVLFCLTVLAFHLSLTTTAETDELAGISENLRQRLQDHFTHTRHHDVNPVNKDNVRNYISETLKDCDLKVELQEFSGTNNQYEGVNVIGILEGQAIGTADDNVVLLGAHYDTTDTTRGVDDNGSGVALLLEAAAMVTKAACKPKNTILFVAFDLEEFQREAFDICIGSKHFVSEWLEPFLRVNETTRSPFQGALVMETVMNYNKSDWSQEFPEAIFLVSEEVHQHLQSRNFSGDFLTVIGRRTDADFSASFTSHLSQVSVPDMYTEIFELPIEGVPSEDEEVMLGDFFRSDHKRFWQKGPPYLPALFITDTADFRVPMTVCYHEPCDDDKMITDDNLLFLARTTKATVNMLIELSTEDATDWQCPVGSVGRLQPYNVAAFLVAAIIIIISSISE